MLTISYASIMAAVVAAAAMGATSAAWVLCGALVKNRVPVRRIQRFENLGRPPSRQVPHLRRRRHVGAHRLDRWTAPVPPRRPVLTEHATVMTHRPRAPRRLAIAAAPAG